MPAFGSAHQIVALPTLEQGAAAFHSGRGQTQRALCFHGNYGQRQQQQHKKTFSPPLTHTPRSWRSLFCLLIPPPPTHSGVTRATRQPHNYLVVKRLRFFSPIPLANSQHRDRTHTRTRARASLPVCFATQSVNQAVLAQAILSHFFPPPFYSRS